MVEPTPADAPAVPVEETKPAAALPPVDSDDWVDVFPPMHLMRDAAKALLKTAEELGHDVQAAVKTISGGFRVPVDVAEHVTLPSEPSDDGRHSAPTPAAAIEKGALPGGADAAE